MLAAFASKGPVAGIRFGSAAAVAEPNRQPCAFIRQSPRVIDVRVCTCDFRAARLHQLGEIPTPAFVLV